MKQARFRKRYPTEEEQEEILTVIEEAISMGWEKYKVYFEENRNTMGKIIMKFYMLPKTELHKTFTNTILKASIMSKIPKNEEIKNKQMQIAERKATEAYGNMGGMKILRRYFFKKDSVLMVGFPYKERSEEKVSFIGTVKVSKNLHPNIYKKCNEDFEEFEREFY